MKPITFILTISLSAFFGIAGYDTYLMSKEVEEAQCPEPKIVQAPAKECPVIPTCDVEQETIIEYITVTDNEAEKSLNFCQAELKGKEAILSERNITIAGLLDQLAECKKSL